ncbi:MAG: hypothetical protein QME52_14475, partial [Bacteroidota bacterium]|nr:hypothetical protein [Bacteroidota bacterium]
ATFLQNMIQLNVHSQYYLERTVADNRECKQCSGYRTDYLKLKKMGNAMIYKYNHFARLCNAQKRYGICGACQEAESNRQGFLRLSQEIADLFNLWVDCLCRCKMESDCDKCRKTVYVGYGPNSQQVSGGYGEGGFGAKGTCVNIIKYKRNECVSVTKPIGSGSPVPIAPPPELKCPESTPNVFPRTANSTKTSTVYPSTGSIIKITNAPVPYNIVGILNDNGNAFIPHVPFNTKLTFSIYDPVTGLYDPDAGTYTTGSTPGGFDRPILLFQPSTSIRTFTMNIGEKKHDSVSLDMQRIDYLLNIGAADTSMLLNIGLYASAPLSIRIQDPEGDLLSDNNNTNCYHISRVKLDHVGTYTLRIAIGVSVEPASFSLGVKYYPYIPLDSFYMCGRFVNDTLFERFSPYVVANPITIQSNDTVGIESGVSIQFQQGGSVISNGKLQGMGTSQKPIILEPASVDSTKITLSDSRNDKTIPSARKEDEK